MEVRRDRKRKEETGREKERCEIEILQMFVIERTVWDVKMNDCIVIKC